MIFNPSGFADMALGLNATATILYSSFSPKTFAEEKTSANANDDELVSSGQVYEKSGGVIFAPLRPE